MDKWAETLQILENDKRWDMKDHPLDEMGHHLDRLNKPKGGVTIRRRVHEDAATQCAYELKRVHSQLRELTDSKDSVDDEDPYELPIDYDHEKNFHGHCFLPDLEGVDDLRHETNPVTTATYSINRIERSEHASDS